MLKTLENKGFCPCLPLQRCPQRQPHFEGEVGRGGTFWVYFWGQRWSPEMENGFALAWKLGLHRDIDHFQNRVFGDAFWGNLMSLFGIITYVSASALVTSSKIPPKTVPKNFIFGKPFSQFGKGEPRPLGKAPIWERVNLGYLCGLAWGIGYLWGHHLDYCLGSHFGYLCGLPLGQPLGLPLRSWVDTFPTFLLLGSFWAKNFRNIYKNRKKVANRVHRWAEPWWGVCLRVVGMVMGVA